MSDITVYNPIDNTGIVGVVRNGKIYRRDVSPDRIRRSIACYKLSEKLGLGIVPSYKQVDTNLTAETWIEGRERLGVEDILTPDGAKIALLDFITTGGSIDRLLWMNAKVDCRGNVWAFDNEHAFSSIHNNNPDWELASWSIFVHLWVKCDSFGNGCRGTTDYHSIIEQVIQNAAPKLTTDSLQGLELTKDEYCWATYRIELIQKFIKERHTLARALFAWRRLVNTGNLRNAWSPSYVTSEQTIPYLSYTLTPNSTIIDIGSAEGEETQFFNSVYGCSVFTLDPRPEAADLLRNKFSGNSKVHIIESAIARHDGTAIMGNTGHAASITLNGDPQERPISGGLQVPTIRLKTLLDKLQSIGVACVALIRMNCEGGEMLVLRDIDKELAEKIDQISFVIHTQMFPLATYYEEIERLKQWYTVLVDKDTPYDRHFLLVRREMWKNLADC